MARRVTSGKAASALAIRASNDRGKAGAASNYLYINYLYKYFFKKTPRSIRSLPNGSRYFTHRFSTLSGRQELYVIDGLSENRVAEGRMHSTKRMDPLNKYPLFLIS